MGDTLKRSLKSEYYLYLLLHLFMKFKNFPHEPSDILFYVESEVLRKSLKVEFICLTNSLGHSPIIGPNLNHKFVAYKGETILSLWMLSIFLIAVRKLSI